MRRLGRDLGPRDILITAVRARMRAVGMNPYRYVGLSRNGTVPLEEGLVEMERREAEGYEPPPRTGGCPECGSLRAKWRPGDLTPTGRYRLQCSNCGHRFTKSAKFMAEPDE
jgi:hypothetical protein